MIGRTIARSLVLAALAAAAGCATATPAPTNDLAVVCDGPCQGGGCNTNSDCKAPLKCETTTHMCVPCIVDGDCPMGQVCGPAHSCGQGCSAQQPCGMNMVCEVDAGACVGCLGDKDCTDQSKPFCDPSTDKCVPCLPTKDMCPQGQYCLQQNNNYGCVPGCKSDKDCSSGGGDGGVSTIFCDPMQHTCVACLKDMDCPNGQICKSGVCTNGCNNQQKCQGTLACCNGACSDTTSDYQNCGMCGTVCQNGYNCCASACSNPANDTSNCGGCGIVCTAAHGTPGCILRKCAIGSCDPGWADCNGSPLDGCEINTDTNVGNCGGCNNPCNLNNASPKCVGGMCQVSACNLGFADCDANPLDGCETNIFQDVNNCSACNTKCALPHATAKCNAGSCAIAVCDAGWFDCNNNPLDGCEINENSDVNNCGMCNHACSNMGGAPACNGGVCGISCNAGLADCDNNPADGCEVNLLTDPNHCGGCGTSCNNLPPNVAVGACQNGNCNAISCQPGYYDIDGSWGDGCECKSDGVSASCGGANNLGALNLGNSTPITGNLVPANKEDWFLVTFNGNHDSKQFHAHVALTTNPNNWFRFDVYADCANTTLGCAVEGNSASTGRTDWEIFWSDQGSGGYNPIPVIGSANSVYVRVYRVAGPVTCDNYVLTVSD